MIEAILIDATNIDGYRDRIIAEIAEASFIGLDVETHDADRHTGLNQYCGYRPDGSKPDTKPLVFDMRRTTLCGLSIWAEGAPAAYYFNLGHADAENRLEWQQVLPILEARPEGSYFICHNLAFELTVLGNTVGWDPLPAIDTYQMAVSAWNPDEYDIDDFIRSGQGGISKLTGLIAKASRGFDPSKPMKEELADLVQKIIAKQSTANHSYNGFVKSISRGYGLKKLVKHFFDYEMTTFQEALGDKVHMGQLTGPEVVDYGADDAYWAVRLFRRILEYMVRKCPEAISAFFDQENPMVPIYASIWRNGWRVNLDAIKDYQAAERRLMAQTLRELKASVRSLLPFPDEPNVALVAYQSWYANNYQKYRNLISSWAWSSDEADDFDECMLVRGPVSNAWAAERGVKESTGPNLSHYMPIRVLLYDLIGADLVWKDGVIQSDGEARGKVRDRVTGSAADVVDSLAKIAGIEQRMKLYITPYLLLTDPETLRMYPVVSSELATRRMASSYPNPMQLAKRGEGSPVRGFYLPDNDEHVLVSLDWSAIELVDIAEKSGDPEFLRAYGQLPHQDLHAGAAADILTVDVPDLTEEIFRSLKTATEWPDLENIKRLKTNIKGEQLPLEKAYSYWRTEIGKGANFNYWYSGFLGTVGERMGWPIEKTGEATERYRERFEVAEEWRVGVIKDVQDNGYVMLPDGHRRVRFEATQEWFNQWCMRFSVEGMVDYNNVMRWIGQKIQKRAYNQAVNAMIQGSCATLAKRSALRIVERIKEMGLDARFVIPVHDELVATVHKSQAAAYIRMARHEMTNHPDLYKRVALDASASIGLTYEPYSKKAPIGQIELMELPGDLGIGTPGGSANDNEIDQVVEYLFDRRKAA